MITRTVSFSAIAILSLLSVLVQPCGTAAQEPSTTMPERLEPLPIFRQEYPFWVSARALDRGNGEMAWDLLRPGRREGLIRLAQQNAEEVRRRGLSGQEDSCAVFRMEGLEDPAIEKSTKDFDSLLRSSNAILRGRILEIDVGFVEGRLPASLLRVQIESTLLAPHSFSLPEEILVAYKQAAVTIGDLTYCSTMGDGFEPKVGDQLIYFFRGFPCDTTGQLSIPTRKRLVFADPTGQLVARERSLEEILLGDGMTTLDELAEMVADALDTGSHSRCGG